MLASLRGSNKAGLGVQKKPKQTGEKFLPTAGVKAIARVLLRDTEGRWERGKSIPPLPAASLSLELAVAEPDRKPLAKEMHVCRVLAPVSQGSVSSVSNDNKGHVGLRPSKGHQE